MAEEDVVVIDCGSETTRIGMAGDPTPRVMGRTVLGEPKLRESIASGSGRSSFVGESALSKHAILNLKYPVEKGIITDWDGIEELWTAYFEEMELDTEAQPMLVLDSPFASDASRERLTQLMFETFNAPSMYIDTTAACSLYASGRTTGIVLESGMGASHVVPFYEGYSFSHLAQQVPICGAELTDYLHEFYTQKLGMEAGSGDCSVTRDICSTLKEAHGSLREASGETVFRDSLSDPVHELPDGTTLTVGEERYNVAECLFDPALIASMIPTKSEEYSKGFSQIVFETVNSCAEEIRDEIYSAIILSGGNTLFPGMAERIKSNVCSWITDDVDTFQSTSNVNVIASSERRHAAWLGGSALASMWSTFRNQKISRGEYDEQGASVVKSKCIR